jgi:NAD(P)-dependent dehydrogenase (short-subunit alcohol dehydrogenase family)
MLPSISSLIDLTGRVAVVTGAGAGMGAVIAQRLAEVGAHVVVADIDGARAESVAAAITGAGGSGEALLLDVRDVDALAPAIEQVATDRGRLDIWVNNAGIYPPRPMFSLSAEDWDTVQDINTRAVFFASREAARQMIRAGNGGVLVNIASIAAFRAGSPSLVPYSTSKAGVVVLTKTMAASLGPHGIRVVGVAPGVIDTDGIRAGAADMAAAGANTANRGEVIPLRRLGTGDDVARTVLFAASDLAAYITGEVITVDGGDMIRGGADVPDLAGMGY